MLDVLFNHLEGWNSEALRKLLWMCPTLVMQTSALQHSTTAVTPLRDEAEVQPAWKSWPLCCSGSVQFLLLYVYLAVTLQTNVMSSSHDVCSYHTTQMSEWMPAGLGLWWELLVMRGGTRCVRWLPTGRQINYSPWSLASARLIWQHMRGINLCNIHERTRKCLKAMRWVRGAHM